MDAQNPLLTIQLVPEQNYDVEQLDNQTQSLLNDLQQIDGVIANRPLAPAPLGSRGDPVTIGTVAIALISGGVITTVIQSIRDWVLRGENRKVRIKAIVDGDTLEVEYTPTSSKEKDLLKFIESLKQLLEKKHK